LLVFVVNETTLDSDPQSGHPHTSLTVGGRMQRANRIARQRSRSQNESRRAHRQTFANSWPLFCNLWGSEYALVCQQPHAASPPIVHPFAPATLPFFHPTSSEEEGLPRGFRQEIEPKEANSLPKRGNPGGISVNLDPIFGIVIFWQYAKLGKIG
ncbi:MAG: hypothetical protein ACK523_02590, partial [Pirellulaceae bacterium]